jgi:hypothetical protein
VYNCAPEVLKTLAPHYRVEKHELITFHMTNIVPPCPAGERCVQNKALGTNLKKSHEQNGHDLMKLTVFVT